MAEGRGTTGKGFLSKFIKEYNEKNPNNKIEIKSSTVSDQIKQSANASQVNQSSPKETQDFDFRVGTRYDDSRNSDNYNPTNSYDEDDKKHKKGVYSSIVGITNKAAMICNNGQGRRRFGSSGMCNTVNDLSRVQSGIAEVKYWLQAIKDFEPDEPPPELTPEQVAYLTKEKEKYEKQQQQLEEKANIERQKQDEEYKQRIQSIDPEEAKKSANAEIERMMKEFDNMPGNKGGAKQYRLTSRLYKIYMNKDKQKCIRLEKDYVLLSVLKGKYVYVDDTHITKKGIAKKQ